MDKHFICIGECHGISKSSGVCGLSRCNNYGHDLIECSCTDNLHEEILLNNKNKKIITRTRAIIFHNDKLLVAEHDTGNFALPGGKLEWGEDLKECLSREIVEELGITPVIGRMLYVNTFCQGNNQSLEFFFEVINGTDFLDVKELEHSKNESSKIIWISKNDDCNLLPKKLNEDLKNGELLSDNLKYITNH